MNNENGRQFPDGYYFDDKSKDAIPESEIKAPESAEATTVTPENLETQPTPEVKLSAKEIAAQRRETVSNFFKNTKEAFKNKAQSTGNNIKNFFGRVKAFGKKGLDASIDVALAPKAHFDEGMDKVKNFIDTKSEQLSKFAMEKAELLELFADFTEYKTKEKYESIKGKAAARYESLKQFGADAIEAGAGKIRGVKEGVRNAKNNMIIAILKSIEEKHRAKADKAAQTIQLLQSLTS